MSYVADARVAEVKRLIDGLRRDRRQHPYRGRGEYSGRAREVAGAIADMIESGGAADAVPLARRAVEQVTAAMLHMEDSSGIIGGDLRMLTALYARACRAAPPDPKQLAAWLVTSRLDGPGWPDIELADFADALGQTGLDEVARLVTERRTAAIRTRVRRSASISCASSWPRFRVTSMPTSRCWPRTCMAPGSTARSSRCSATQGGAPARSDGRAVAWPRILRVTGLTGFVSSSPGRKPDYTPGRSGGALRGCLRRHASLLRPTRGEPLTSKILVKG